MIMTKVSFGLSYVGHQVILMENRDGSACAKTWRKGHEWSKAVLRLTSFSSQGRSRNGSPRGMKHD
jgi:hypothetical protein